MANATIQISLSGGEAEGEWMRFEPGSVLQGTAQIVPQGDIRCNHVYVRLQWHTEGRGTRNEGRVGEIDMAQGTLAANTPLSQNFHFTLPKEPWSYAGHYINIVWEVVVNIDIPLAPDLNFSQPFILAPGRR
ncbi:MAG: hypothetical protein HYZ49_17050 [Chloroflexi bacterium]|nr:hypothetical protein [Chloroflexota bacterium]